MSMFIRAKMQCLQVTKTNWGAEIVKLSAVFTGDNNSEDNTYARATPSATVEMTIDNVHAHGAFVPGQKYYVDFTYAAEVSVDDDILLSDLADARKGAGY